jgi:hypothetical protein
VSVPEQLRLPPAPRLPRPVQALALLAAQRPALHALRRRYGPVQRQPTAGPARS